MPSFKVYKISSYIKYVKLAREGNWTHHVSSVREMLPWFHAYDCTDYVRFASLIPLGRHGNIKEAASRCLQTAL